MRGDAGGRCHPLIIQKYITCHLQYDIKDKEDKEILFQVFKTHRKNM